MKLITLAPQFAPFLSGSIAIGAMGIMDFMEDEEGTETESDGDELFDDGLGGDDFDDLEGGMDDGMDDWGGGGGEFGEMGGGSTQELENRLQDLENEVGDIASTVSTVRSENEQISEKVDDVEENVRKLLEIYEMVTRGVNPFVDDVPSGGLGGDAFGGGEDGGFGLFDDEEDPDEEEDLDDDIADADAESFFDDSFDDIEEDEEMDDVPMETDETEDDGQSGGSTFQELKEEYESGDADWADEDDSTADAGAESETAFDVEPEQEPPTELTPDTGEFEFEEPAETNESRAVETAMAMRNGMQKPYLAALPAGYIVDLVVMEWLEFLVDEFGSEDAVRTIAYYRNIDWISESVEEQLLAFVRGIADVTEVDTDATPATLGVNDHVRSLTFMSQLTGDAIEQKVVDHCARIRGEGHGLQR